MRRYRSAVVVCPVIVAVFLLAVGVHWLTAVQHLEGTIVARTWSRSVDIGAQVWAQRTTVNVPPPSGARNVSSAYTVVGSRTESYADGQTCTKNLKGMTTCTTNDSTRLVSVWGWRYTYEVQEWQVQRTAEARGDSDAPTWPTPTLGPDQSVGDHHQWYRLDIHASNGTTYTVDTDQGTWATRPVGDTVRLTVNRLDQASLDP